MQCVILAGGLGTRMRPLTETMPKFLLPVNGRPFADYQLAWLAGQGVDRVLLLIGYMGERIEKHVGDGSAHGLQVRYVHEGESLRGTAGAVRLAVESGEVDEKFLLLYGDSFLPVDIGAVWREFEDREAPALMTVLRNGDRWDRSNVIYRDGWVELYDKRREHARRREMAYIDYGLSGYRRSVSRIRAENSPAT
ncbi:MAG: sugar phosphate nucleotidyltransferase [Bryobacterales bacterium]